MIQGKGSGAKENRRRAGRGKEEGHTKGHGERPEEGRRFPREQVGDGQKGGTGVQMREEGGEKTRSLENAALGLLLDDGRLERGDDRFIKDILELLAELVSHCMQPWQHEERAQTPTPEPERRTYPLLCQC